MAADDEDEKIAAGGAVGSAAGGSAAAFALNAASRAEADAYLRKQGRLADEQTVLVRLQADDLRREDKLRHWSLRVHHISDVMKLSFEFAVAIILLGLVVLLAGAVWSAANDNGLVIESFSVPPDLVARGITGQVVASKVLDRLNAMQSATISERAPSSYANNWGNDIKVQIPDTGVSIGEFLRYLDSSLGHETHITGDVYRTASGYAVVARIGSIATPTITGSDLDALVSQAASAIYRMTQPYRYAMSLWGGGSQFNPPNATTLGAIASLRELATTGDTEDRAWASDAVGDFSLFQGDPETNIRWLDRSLAIKPGIDALLDYQRVYAILEHNQQQLDRAEALLALARRGGGTEILPVHRDADINYSQQLVAVLQGDNMRAVELAPQKHQTDLRVVVGPFDQLGRLYGCAGMHDGACVDEINDLDPIPPSWHAQAELALGRYEDVVREEPAVRAELAKLHKFGQLITQRQTNPNLAFAEAELGDFAGAHALIDPTPADCDLCMRMRGRIAALEHRYDDAGKDFAMVAARSPSIPFADSDWGAMLMAKGDFDGAIAKFAAANKLGPHFADPLEGWGEALMLKNRSDLAVAKFAEAAKYAPNWGHLHLMWGKALFYAGQKDEARKEFAAARRLDLSPADEAELTKWMMRG